MLVLGIKEMKLYTEKTKVLSIRDKKKYKKLFLSAFSQNQIFGVKLQQFSQYKRIIY
jgi:hypothetical protein